MIRAGARNTGGNAGGTQVIVAIIASAAVIVFIGDRPATVVAVNKESRTRGRIRNGG